MINSEGEWKMAEKKRWTVIDTVIVVVVAAAAAGAYMFFGGNVGGSGSKDTVEAVILISGQPQEFIDALTIGDSVTLSLTEKDSGTLKDIRTEPAEAMVYDSLDGTYAIDTIDGQFDTYATVEVDCEITDYAITVGSTDIKVGTGIPFRGKGYATEGYVVAINE